MQIKRTPWGAPQFVKERGPGVVFVSTAGHGGIKLDRAKNAQIHAAWRRKGGWYEEDVDWAIVAVTLGAAAGFDADAVKDAHRTLKDYFPGAYETVYGVSVGPEESSVVREREARKMVAGRPLMGSCFGDWSVNVPKGRVGICVQLDNGAEAYYTISLEQHQNAGVVVAGHRTRVRPLPEDAIPVDGSKGCPFGVGAKESAA